MPVSALLPLRCPIPRSRSFAFPSFTIPWMQRFVDCPLRRDGAGEIAATGPNSKWKVGDRVFICPLSWDDEETQGVPTLEQAKPKGAGNVQGTLRQWAILVSLYSSSIHIRHRSPLGERSASCILHPAPLYRIDEGKSLSTSLNNEWRCEARQRTPSRSSTPHIRGNNRLTLRCRNSCECTHVRTAEDEAWYDGLNHGDWWGELCCNTGIYTLHLPTPHSAFSRFPLHT